MGINNFRINLNSDMISPQRHHKVPKMSSTESLIHYLDDLEREMYSPASTISDDMWKKFDLPTPPLSPRHEGEEDLSLENIGMPFDLDTEDLMLLDDECVAAMMHLTAETFPESPPDSSLQSNLIQDIMWPAGSKAEDLNQTTPKDKTDKRIRCDSCSGRPFNPECVAPEEVFPYETTTTIGGALSQTRLHGLGTETPSDSEEEIDVVNDVAVEKYCRVTVPSRQRSRYDTETEKVETTQTVTLTIGHKSYGCTQNVSRKCSTVPQKVECPTDVHNYSLPVSSLKRVRSFPTSPDTNKSAKRLKRDISIPSELRRVAQKLKSSVSSGSCSSRSSSDSEEFCDAGKRNQHNVLERKRRTDLKNSFFHLRDSVPELEGQERAPKVVILRKASQYINRLNDDSRRYEKEMEQLKIKKEKLKRQLAKLRDL